MVWPFCKDLALVTHEIIPSHSEDRGNNHELECIGVSAEARNSKSSLNTSFIRDIDAGVVSCPHGGPISLRVHSHEVKILQDFERLGLKISFKVF